VKREKYPTKHRYVFELMVDIDSAVGLSAGELAALVVEGLFALDQQGVLFPGLTTPEHRLITFASALSPIAAGVAQLRSIRHIAESSRTSLSGTSATSSMNWKAPLTA
jgi:hypothetical protein